MSERALGAAIAILWRYRVKPEHRHSFEAIYGPDGDWARLFALAPGYGGTELLRDGDHYATIDRWRSAEDFRAFQAAHHADYAALDRRTADWTEEEVRIGMFSIVR